MLLPVLIAGFAPTQMQNLALGLVELHEVHTGPLLELVQVPQACQLHTHLGVICKLADDAFDPTVYVTDEDIKQYWSQYGPLRNTTYH